MKSKEEIYAQQLYTELQQKLIRNPNFLFRLLGIRTKPEITVTLENVGTKWGCQVSNGLRSCYINCNHIDRSDTSYKGLECFTLFKEKNKGTIEGRTFSKPQTIEAVKDWMHSKTIEELYERFTFIEEEKRQLEKLRLSILEFNPRETEVPQGEVMTDHFSTTSLWFVRRKRSARIYYHGYDPKPRYIFYWNDSRLFELSFADSKRGGALIARWIFDKAKPSVLQLEFPELTFESQVSLEEIENEDSGL